MRLQEPAHGDGNGDSLAPVGRESKRPPEPARLKIELLEDRTAPIVIWGDAMTGCP